MMKLYKDPDGNYVVKENGKTLKSPQDYTIRESVNTIEVSCRNGYSIYFVEDQVEDLSPENPPSDPMPDEQGYTY